MTNGCHDYLHKGPHLSLVLSTSLCTSSTKAGSEGTDKHNASMRTSMACCFSVASRTAYNTIKDKVSAHDDDVIFSSE